MLRKSHGGLYKAQTQKEREKVRKKERRKERKKEDSERLRGEREIRSSLLALDLKDGKL